MSATDLDSLIASRGAATPAELGLEPKQVLDLAKKRPDLEPVFLVKFRSRQGKTRVEEVRAYAWPSTQLALRHLGYLADDKRLLRLEPRQPVPFPARLYATYADKPKMLEELRTLEKQYQKAMKQAPSKPGRAEMDITPLQTAFKKLGDDVVMEMWIDAAATFQRIDNQSYASKMLGNLLKVVEKSKVDHSLLARTVLSAADDGVFNAKLYDHTWDQLGKKLGTGAALGFGLRVFRRLIESGRALPTDFIKDMRKAADKGKVAGFDKLLDSQIVWAAGQAPFWNTAKKSAEWRDSPTEEHKETSLLRARLGEMWKEASAEWRDEVWGRVSSSFPELTVYGRTILVEFLLENGSGREDLIRLLDGVLALLTRKPRESDRARVETDGHKSFAKIAAEAPELFWERAAEIEGAMRSATGDLTTFTALADTLSDVSESLGARDGKTIEAVLPGRVACWIGALVAALTKELPKENADDEDEYYDDDDDSAKPPMLALLGEALGLVTPDGAAEALAELGPLLARKLAASLQKEDRSLGIWEPVLARLQALGPVGQGVLSKATELFVKAEKGPDFGHAARVAHYLDAEPLRGSAEARHLTDEAIDALLTEVAPDGVEHELVSPNSTAFTIVGRRDGDGWLLLFQETLDDDDAPRNLALCRVGKDGKQETLATGKMVVEDASLWISSKGIRVVVCKDRKIQILDDKLKVVKKWEVDEEWGGSKWGSVSAIPWGEHAIVHRRGEANLIDTSFNVVGEYESDEHYGNWAFLEAAGQPPIAVHNKYGTIEVWPEPKTRVLVKIPDLTTLEYLARTDDGAWFIDYVGKKAAKKRARWENGAFVTGPRGPIDRKVTDLVGVGKSIDAAITNMIAIVDDEEVIAFDGASLGKLSCEPFAIDLATGDILSGSAMVADPTLPPRLAAAGDLRAAKSAESMDPVLDRALYGDAKGLAKTIGERLGQRPAGARALAILGAHTGVVLDAAAQALADKLQARIGVLRALDAPAPTPRAVPPRKPGVPRAEIRRAIRTTFQAPINELVFWALDAADAGPLVEYLLPDGEPVDSDALKVGLELVGLAQDAKTSDGMAARALDAADAIARAIAAPGRIFSGSDSDSSYRDGGPRTVDRTGLLFALHGGFDAKTAPISASDDAVALTAEVTGWLAKTFGCEVKPLGETDDRELVEDGDSVNVPLFEGKRGPFTMKLGAIAHKKGFDWFIDSIDGNADGPTWDALVRDLEAKIKDARPLEEVPVWPIGARAEDRALLESAATLTRSRLGDRSSLQPLSWPAPDAAKGLPADERDRRFVMLAWVFGTLKAEDAGTTKPSLEKIASSCKIVSKNWYGLQPNREKIDTQAFEIARAQTVVNLASRGREAFQDSILIGPVERLVEAFATMAGGKKGGGK